jgi:hypothetical protein
MKMKKLKLKELENLIKVLLKKKKKKEKKDAVVFMVILAWTNMSVKIGIIDWKLLKKMDGKDFECIFFI